MAQLPIDVAGFYNQLDAEGKLSMKTPIVVDYGIDENHNNDNLGTKVTFLKLEWDDYLKNVKCYFQVEKYLEVNEVQTTKFKWYKTLTADNSIFIDINTYEPAPVSNSYLKINVMQDDQSVEIDNPDYDPNVMSEYDFFRIIASMPVADDALVKVFCSIGYSRGAFYGNA